MGHIEALYIFDEHNTQLFDHVYTGRPAAASVLIQQYLQHPAPRPSLIYLPNIRPATCLFSFIHNRILFLCPASGEIDPLLVIEFLHRVADALEEFVGTPLLPPKIEANYDVVAQIVEEMCDAGVVSNTEPDALREVVETSSWMGSLLEGFGLPSSAPSLGSRVPGGLTQVSSVFSRGTGDATATSASGSAIPWRRSNVRHTSNELYVDIIEKLSVIVAPSGRPISAFANGTIAFTSKLSGVPDLTLRLTAPGGRNGIQHAMDLPCFHPCVRLSRWRERPGEMSFIPPDGKFVLAAYECDLLPDLFSEDAAAASGKMPTTHLNLPLSLELTPGAGPNGDELEVRLTVNTKSGAASTIASDFTTNKSAETFARPSRAAAALSSLQSNIQSNLQSNSGTSASPLTDDIVVTIPTRATVRNLLDLRATAGEAHHLPNDEIIEWRIARRQLSGMERQGAVLRCTILGDSNGAEDEHGATLRAPPLQTDNYDYNEDTDGAATYQSLQDQNGSDGAADPASKRRNKAGNQHDETGASLTPTPKQHSASFSSLMPQSAQLSFSVKGWLASGIKVDSLTINTRASRGLGAGVTPYKGVKYHTVSQQGIEVRC